ncbi:outer membrane beta-barrel protein [Devosia rhodophyticola]|uniref:Outer membrane beta-barrel protein n=1 Tax=Devosia rhodophyticola TaxID=3026423 RepID=A0ABY7Z2G6_9HYPH|nr:outer membrane beta-barrel protein [Devosia rhodophyticola]WDR07602.1 outer membrane beta-barrel protein [Devosia rhodophyticola]
MFGAVLLSVLVASFSGASGLGAEQSSIPVTLPVQVSNYSKPAFDWNGFYSGIFTGIQTNAIGGTQYGLGVNLGVNAAFGFYLVGGEVNIEGLTGGPGSTSYAEILGRAGVIVADNVLVYGAAGYGVDLGVPDEQDWLAGAGVEIAVGDDFSLRGQYVHAFPGEGSIAKDQFTIGAAYHF